MGVLKFMRAGVMDPCAIREDVRRRVDLNGGAGSLVGPGGIYIRSSST